MAEQPEVVFRLKNVIKMAAQKLDSTQKDKNTVENLNITTHRILHFLRGISLEENKILLNWLSKNDHPVFQVVYNLGIMARLQSI